MQIRLASKDIYMYCSSMALSSYDDLPIHQIPSTVDHVVSGDPRWFDRYWFTMYDRAGRFAIATGLGVYKNANTADGFASISMDGLQRNVRVSRILRPELSPEVGPLRYEVIEGLRKIRLVLERGEHPISFDLIFESEFDAFEEDHHFSRIGGMVEQDYLRFYQHGRASGFVQIDSRRIEVEDLWAFRDRSFGVRPRMGGPMPDRAPDRKEGLKRSELGIAGGPALTFGCAFGSSSLAGCCTFGESADGTLLSIDGRYSLRGEHRARPITSVTHDLSYTSQGTITGGAVVLASGEQKLSLEFEPMTAPFAYQGFGYLNGYRDGLGLGAYRGDNVVEYDDYRVDPHGAVDLSSKVAFGKMPMLDQPMKATVNGEAGFMEVVAVLSNGHSRYSGVTRG